MNNPRAFAFEPIAASMVGRCVALSGRLGMLLVATYVAPSSVEGVGVFADEDIAAGSVIWRFDPLFDRLLSVSEIAALDRIQQDHVTRYGYGYPMDRTLTVLESDNGRFMNHSDRPNTVFSDPHFGYALKDIAAGAEILCDYNEFDPDFTMLPGKLFVKGAVLEQV